MTNYNEMIHDIKVVLDKYKKTYVPIDNESSIKLIHKLYKFDVCEFDDSLSNDTEQLYVGCYYMFKEQYTEAIKYYKMAIEKGNSGAMINLARYYEKIEKNYVGAFKYYKMATDKGNSNAMNSLALYYEKIEEKYTEAIKCYKMAIDKGNSASMYNLARHYEDIEENYTKATKYYKMAIDNGDSDAMNYLAYYYYNIEMNYMDAIKYYKMAISNGNTKRINELIDLYELHMTPKSKNILREYINLLVEHKNQIPNFSKLFEKNIGKLFAEYDQIDDQIRKILYNYQFENDTELNLKLGIYLTTGVIPKKNLYKYIRHYLVIIDIRRSKLPINILRLIGGYLFI